MQCVVYKSRKKSDTYIFVKNENDFECVPESLLQMLGELEMVMSVDLAQRDKLAQADPIQVKANLLEHGYYLQLPPTAYITGAS